MSGETVYVLRTCRADLTSYDGFFVWPESGPVSCPDWNPRTGCGNGLHGLLWGEGDGSLLNWYDDAKWLVVAVDRSLIVDLGGKVKFPEGDVAFCGGRAGAVAFIVERGADPAKCVGGTASAGDGGTAMAGYRGTASAGDGGTAMAGYRGTASAGDGGTASAGSEGFVSGGHGSIICAKWWDEKAERYRLAVGYVGEAGIRANTRYRVVEGVSRRSIKPASDPRSRRPGSSPEPNKQRSARIEG
jgi:hypothetical protein